MVYQDVTSLDVGGHADVYRQGKNHYAAWYFKLQDGEMQKTLGHEDLKKLIKEGIREVLREERLSLCEIMIPYASKKEFSEIQTKFGSPGNYREEDFADMTDWVKA